jgi:hypothetical protein
MEFNGDHLRRIDLVGGFNFRESYSTIGRKTTFFVAMFTWTAGNFGGGPSPV